MFVMKNATQMVALGLLAASTLLLVVSWPIILWLIRRMNIAAEVPAPSGEEWDPFVD
jgi:hypothetical protein